MGHPAAVWDYRAATEITKDCNGIDKIVLRSPRGASARVSLHGGQVTSWRSEQGEELLFTSSKVDRVYLSSPNVVAVLDHEKKRTYVIRKEGLPDVVVWNPYEKKSRSMADFGDDEYKQMLCLDGAVIEKPVTLKPGEEWTGRLELSVLASILCSEHF